MIIPSENDKILALLQIFCAHPDQSLDKLSPKIASFFDILPYKASDLLSKPEFAETIRLMKEEWLINFDAGGWNNQQGALAAEKMGRIKVSVEIRGRESLREGKILSSVFGRGRTRSNKQRTAPTPVSKTTDGMRGLVARKREDVPARSTVNNIAASIAARQGQRVFREALLTAYGNRCLVTGPNIQDILEAAHIQPYADGGPSTLANGLLLRADIHTLFDLYLIAIDVDMTVLTSPQLCGTPYADLAGKSLQFPDGVTARPDEALLKKHREAAGLG